MVLDDVKFGDYDFLRITPNLVQTDPALGLWTLPALQAIHKLTCDRDRLADDEILAKICGGEAAGLED